MDALLTLFIVLFISIVITRIAMAALVHTGLSTEMAKLQARSALSGCGYTTQESEKMVNHPIRRKILMRLMLFGNVGVVAALSSVVIGFMSEGVGMNSYYGKILITIVGLIVLYYISKSKKFDIFLSKIIGKFFHYYFKHEDYHYENILHLQNNYKIAEIYINKNEWMANKTIGFLEEQAQDVIILGVKSKSLEYGGFPDKNRTIEVTDIITIYGKEKSIVIFKGKSNLDLCL